MVHGAFNEFWGPHGLKARWLPALRDGLWHHSVEIADGDVAVCFTGISSGENPRVNRSISSKSHGRASLNRSRTSWVAT